MHHFDIQHWINQFGYAGVFCILLAEMIGVPFPAETTLTFSGIEWTKGSFSIIPLVIAATSGNVVGSTIAYGIGRFLGKPVILKCGRFVGITEERLTKAEEKFRKYRSMIVLFAKFVAGIRVLVPYLSGINRMPFLLFTIYNTISAFVWSFVFIVLGRYIEMIWKHYHRVLHHFWIPALIVAGIFMLYVMMKKITYSTDKSHKSA